MPLPSYYHQLPLGGDSHYGKEQFTKRHFLLGQKGIYPILALVGMGVCLAVGLSVKNLSGNPNVALRHGQQGNWNNEEAKRVNLDVAARKRPQAASVLAEEEH